MANRVGTAVPRTRVSKKRPRNECSTFFCKSACSLCAAALSLCFGFHISIDFASLAQDRHRLGRARRSWMSSDGAERRSSLTACRAESKLYEVLGVSKDASVSEIKKAYYREARNNHPDTHPGDDAKFERFQTIAEAYQTLADPVRRQKYDLEGLAALAHLKTNATRLFGPPPWRVLIGCTDHYMWDEDRKDYFLGLMASCIPNGIAGVTLKTLNAAYDEARATRVAVLLDRVSEMQAKDTVEAIEEFGLAVKAEPIEGERINEKESPLMAFRRVQRELGETTERLRLVALEISIEKDNTAEFEETVEAVKSLRSELRAAAQGLQEFKQQQSVNVPAVKATVPVQSDASSEDAIADASSHDATVDASSHDAASESEEDELSGFLLSRSMK